MTTEHYRCPHCSTVYDNELLARVHVTRADDDQHAVHNGLTSDCEIEVVNDDGTVIDHRTRQPDETDLSTLTRADFPDELSPKRTDAVLVAARYPNVTTRTELTDLIEEELADTDHDPPTHWTVRRALDAFYQPHESSLSTDESFSEIPVLQQAIIIANLTLPEASIAEIAGRVDCAESYPPQVMERRQYLVEDFADRQAEGESLAAIVHDELPATHLEELVESGHLNEIPIDVGSSPERHATQDDDAATATTSEQLDSDWGAPTDDHEVMTASPPAPSADNENTESSQTNQDVGRPTTQPAGDEPSPEEASDSDATEETGETATETDMETCTAAETPNATSDGGSASVTANGETINSGPPAEKSPQPAGGGDVVTGDGKRDHPDATVLSQLQQLKSNLEFFRKAAAPINETSQERPMVVSLAEQTEAQCDQIIRQLMEDTDVHRG